MENGIIPELIAQNKRLVIPGFGTFLLKEDITQNIVLTPFLKNDDGVLVAALCAKHSIDTAQAHSIILKFITDINDSLATIGKFYIANIGVLTLDAQGVMGLVCDQCKTQRDNPKPQQPQFTPPPTITSHNPIPQPQSPQSPQAPQQPQFTTPVQQQVIAPQPITDTRPRPQSAWVTPGNVPQRVPQPLQQQPIQPLQPQPQPQPQAPQYIQQPQPVQPQPVQQQPVQRRQPAPRPQQPLQQQPIGKQMGAPVIGNRAPQRVPRPVQVPQPLQHPAHPQHPQNNQQAPFNTAPDNRLAQRPPLGPSTHGPQNSNEKKAYAQMMAQKNKNNKPKPNKKNKSGKPNGKTDVWLLGAIILAVLVTALLVYSLIVTNPLAGIFPSNDDEFVYDVPTAQVDTLTVEDAQKL